jgi:hypothetical protein
MPKQINTYQVGQALVRKFGLKGRFQPVLDEVIVPVVNVGETLEQSVRLAAGGLEGVTAGAGNQNLITFRNGAGSGIIATVKSWNAVSGAPITDYLSITAGTTTGTVGTGAFWRDLRLAGVPRSYLARSASPAAVITAPFYHLDIDSKQWAGEWILLPGQILSFRQNAQNTTLDLLVFWEETDITASLGG